MKSDYGLPARSNSTKSSITYEEYSLRWDLAFGLITKQEFERRLKDVTKKVKDR